MTSQPQPVPGEGRSAGSYLRPLRDIASWVLVGATAVLLFVAVVRLIPGGENEFGFRSQDSFYGFVNLATILFPLAAVLLALLVEPRHPKAQLIVLVALVEYAVMAFFGLFFGLLIGLINHASNNGARIAFEELLVRAAWLGVFGVAAYAVFQIWRGMFQVAKPKPQPGMYGQPQYAPGGFPGQPQQPQPQQPQQQYGAPQGFPPPGPGFPPPPQQGQPPQQTYGQPGQPPSWNQPAVPIPGTPPFGSPQGSAPQGSAPHGSSPHGSSPQESSPHGGFPQGNAPQSAPPFSAPQSAPPFSAPQPSAPQPNAPQPNAPQPNAPQSAPPGPFSEPTQTFPQQDPNADRTEKIGDDRPGFGPADQDPPRQ